ncbi:MAG: DHH family phosphoesterase [Candidatus Omnitrophica bacterium]|nr:DHH family phosphoesterase [Candidatus Omnitrophota bacterium]
MNKEKDKQDITTSCARRLLHFLSKNKGTLSPLLILTHDYPDPDALASAFALQYLAENAFGIRSKIAYGGIIGRMENRAMVKTLKLPIYMLKPADLRKHEHIALVDTQPDFENNSFPKKRKATIVIDQHPPVNLSRPAADLTVLNTECGATCVILARAILIQCKDFPPRVATALAYGILSDTLYFYRADRPDVIRTYLDLIHFCDFKALAYIQNPSSRPKSFFTSLGQGIQNAKARRGLVISHLGFVENPDLVSQVADFLLSYRNANNCVCTGRFRGKLYVSLRMSNPNAEAGEILRDAFANRDEAGGRGPIAGGSLRVGGEASEETWQERENELAEKLLKRLRIPVRGEFYLPFRKTTKA